MLLVQMTIGGVVHYISGEYLDVEHFYEAKVVSLASLRIATSRLYGGYAAPTFGDIELLPDLFDGHWPPPVTCAIKIMIGDTGEAGAFTVFEGTAYLQNINRDGISYQLHGNNYTNEVTDYLYSGTLNAVFTTACSALGLTLNTTYARATSPTVYWQTSGTTKLIDNLSTIAESFSHRFYIQAGTLYLVDTLLDNGSALALTEFDVFPSSYRRPAPLKEVTAQYKGTPLYVGVLISATGGGVAAIAELKFYDEAGVVMSNLGAEATSYTTGYPPGYTVDGNLGTRWASGAVPSPTSPQRLWGQPAKIGLAASYAIVAGATDYLTQAPTSWTVQGFDPGANYWAEISTEKQTTAWGSNEERKFNIGDLVYTVRVAGSYPFGDSEEVNQIASNTYATIVTCLTDIKTTLERPRVEIAIPLTASLPKIGQRVTLVDESLFQATTIWARVAAMVYDFDNDQCVIEGEGALT